VKHLIHILGTSLGIGALFAGVAAAASLGISTSGLAAGNASGVRCVSSSLTATRSVDNSATITSVSVLNVPQACANETLSVTLRNGAGASLGQASASVGSCVGGCTITLSSFGSIAAANLAGYSISVVE
jgi:hypothetical protein